MLSFLNNKNKNVLSNLPAIINKSVVLNETYRKGKDYNVRFAVVNYNDNGNVVPYVVRMVFEVKNNINYLYATNIEKSNHTGRNGPKRVASTISMKELIDNVNSTDYKNNLPLDVYYKLGNTNYDSNNPKELGSKDGVVKFSKGESIDSEGRTLTPQQIMDLDIKKLINSFDKFFIYFIRLIIIKIVLIATKVM